MFSLVSGPLDNLKIENYSGHLEDYFFIKEKIHILADNPELRLDSAIYRDFHIFPVLQIDSTTLLHTQVCAVLLLNVDEQIVEQLQFLHQQTRIHSGVITQTRMIYFNTRSEALTFRFPEAAQCQNL